MSDELSRQQHIQIATSLRQKATKVLNNLGDTDPLWVQAGALEAQAQVLLATSHEAAASRLDAEQFRKDLNTVHPSGWQLPAEVVEVGRTLLEDLARVRHDFELAFAGSGPADVVEVDKDDASGVEALAQFVSRLLNEIESRKLVQTDEA